MDLTPSVFLIVQKLCVEDLNLPLVYLFAELSVWYLASLLVANLLVQGIILIAMILWFDMIVAVGTL